MLSATSDDAKCHSDVPQKQRYAKQYAKQVGATLGAVLLLSTVMSAVVIFSINVKDPLHQQVALADENPLFLWSEGTHRAPTLRLTVPPTCKMGGLPTLWKHEAKGPHLKVKVLTYNLYWWSLYGQRQGNHGSAAKLIKHTGLQEPYDVMAFQECMDPTRILLEAGLLDQYMAFKGDGSGTSAICVLFHRANWALLAHGSSYVAEDTQAEYYGRRAAQWLHLRHRVTGHGLFVMNHHGPLPVNSGGRCGGKGIAYNLLQLIARHAQHGEAIVLVGDFNANAASATIRHLQQRLFRTYAGNFLGGIDNVFSNIEASAVVQRANLGKGGSDHDALSVTLSLGNKAVNPNIPSSPPALPLSAGSASITMLPQASQRRPAPTPPALP
jgi:endonuclease/exonuclease/phosphatase family metal-dependent hydrolase